MKERLRAFGSFFQSGAGSGHKNLLGVKVPESKSQQGLKQLKEQKQPGPETIAGNASIFLIMGRLSSECKGSGIPVEPETRAEGRQESPVPEARVLTPSLAEGAGRGGVSVFPPGCSLTFFPAGSHSRNNRQRHPGSRVAGAAGRALGIC